MDEYAMERCLKIQATNSQRPHVGLDLREKAKDGAPGARRDGKSLHLLDV